MLSKIIISTTLRGQITEVKDYLLVVWAVSLCPVPRGWGVDVTAPINPERKDLEICW